jgi:hypothetical protein
MLDRPSTVIGRSEYDINAKAVRYWSLIFHECFDLRGRPLACVVRLGNPDAIIDVNKRRPDGPRLVHFQGPGITGSWSNLGPPGASGTDLLELIQWASGGCDRRVAGDFLRSLCDRIVSVEAA